MADFEPEPLTAPLTAEEERQLEAVPVIVGGNSTHPQVTAPSMSGTKPRTVVNLASFNFTGMVEAPEIRECAIKTLREYGVGSCSPPGFYGTSDMHLKLERDIASFLGKENSIVYSQAFSTINSVIPAFCKRGDYIVADASISFAGQKAIQLSRSNVYWYNHNDMQSLEDVLQLVCEQQERSKEALKRRFIFTEGIFESDGAMVDLPKLVELKERYRFRLFLDETYSFGTMGATGRGLTELQNVAPDKVDFIIGSLATTLAAGGGFCAASDYAVHHQRINGLSFIFSAAMPVMLVAGARVALEKIQNQPEILARLHENTRAFRGVLDKVQSAWIPSAAESPVVHIQVRSRHGHPVPAQRDSSKLAVPEAATDAVSTHDLSKEEQAALLQAVVDDALNAGVFLCCPRRLPSINAKVLETGPSSLPSIRVCISSELTRAEVTQAADIVRASLVRVLGERR